MIIVRMKCYDLFYISFILYFMFDFIRIKSIMSVLIYIYLYIIISVRNIRNTKKCFKLKLYSIEIIEEFCEDYN